MGLFINPSNRGQGSSPVPSTKKTDSPAKTTAEKVAQLPGMQVLREAKQIQRDWNRLDPSALAERIIDLEDKVKGLEGSNATIDRVRKIAERLHFQFVFPVALELSTAPEAGMPFSFARVVHSVAKQVLQNGSAEPMKQLSPEQISEVMRFARREV